MTKEEFNKILRNLKIDGVCISARQVRHLCFFDIQLQQKPSAVRKIKSSLLEISLALKSKTEPKMEIIPEEGIVRLSVPVSGAETIFLKDIYKGNIGKGILPILLGESDIGEKMWIDMNDNPHLLVAGTTGSGKSSLIHTIIANCLWINSIGARKVELKLADPKRVEFNTYNELVSDIRYTYNDTVAMLESLVETMESRYEEFRAKGIRSFEECYKKLNSIVCIVDEVSDLMMQDDSKILQNLIIRLAQKGRACGIFMILSTQRPSVNVLNGVIKANFPGRVACKTASRKDSEVILDESGAEHLLGKGDAYIKNSKINLQRFQVAYILPEEIVKMNDAFLKCSIKKATRPVLRLVTG